MGGVSSGSFVPLRGVKRETGISTPVFRGNDCFGVDDLRENRHKQGHTRKKSSSSTGSVRPEPSPFSGASGIPSRSTGTTRTSGTFVSPSSTRHLSRPDPTQVKRTRTNLDSYGCGGGGGCFRLHHSDLVPLLDIGSSHVLPRDP